MSSQLISKRIKALRIERNLTQGDLARILGFNDRQTISAIETGSRRVTADELMNLAEKLSVPMEYFIDPFMLAGEGQFSWRHTYMKSTQLQTYERDASRLIATFRTLAPQVQHKLPLFRFELPLHRNSSYEEAAIAGERFAEYFKLGEVPAKRLMQIMENKLGVLILLVDLGKFVSGVVCRLPELDSVLINRHEVSGRRNFTLAHELFHILTWNMLPPNVRNKRVEQLSDNFAGAMLMPEASLARFGNWSELAGQSLIRRLNEVANEMHVTAIALKWRLASLGKISFKIAQELPDEALRNNGRRRSLNDPAPLFSKRFLEVIALALEMGIISLRRIATTLELSIDDLENAFAEHDIVNPSPL